MFVLNYFVRREYALLKIESILIFNYFLRFVSFAFQLLVSRMRGGRSKRLQNMHKLRQGGRFRKGLHSSYVL